MAQKRFPKIGALEISRNGPEAVSRAELISRNSEMKMLLVAAAVSTILVAGLLLMSNSGTALINPKGTESGILGIENEPSVQSTLKSGSATISDYYSGSYTTKLACSIVSPTGSFDVYCDGSPIYLYGLPDGMYTLKVAGSLGLEIDPVSIDFAIS